jgi:2-polyprenyl-3-methyl-5-hydroxy-6-metoxy-1,4-benzoquinol methylase
LREIESEPFLAASARLPAVQAAESSRRLKRWASEAAFFDDLAAKLSAETGRVPQLQIQRYILRPRLWYSKEFRFRWLGDLSGQRVLDLGCGEGSNAILLAKAGAYVVGVDLSSASIKLCRARMAREGLEDRAEFHCTPLETFPLPAQTFDVVWGDGILHHVIDELDTLLPRLAAAAKPGAKIVFAEPVAFSRWLRTLRRHVPIHVDATPDERPLERAEIAIIARHMPYLQRRPFLLFSRLSRFLLHGGHYEVASRPRRVVTDALFALDYLLLSLPLVRPLCGACVFFGRTDK